MYSQGGNETLTLPTAWTTSKFEQHKVLSPNQSRPRLGPDVTVTYTMKYDLSAERRMLWSHPNKAEMFAVPPMGQDDVYLFGETMAARLLYGVKAKRLMQIAYALFGMLFWQSYVINVVVLPTTVLGIVELGLSNYTTSLLLIGVMLMLLSGRRRRQGYAENARQVVPFPMPLCCACLTREAVKSCKGTCRCGHRWGRGSAWSHGAPAPPFSPDGAFVRFGRRGLTDPLGRGVHVGAREAAKTGPKAKQTLDVQDAMMSPTTHIGVG